MRPGGACAVARRWVGWLLVFSLLALPSAGMGAVDGARIWLFIDSKQRTVAVMHGSERVEIFHGAAFGRGGVAPFRREGDGKTPMGVFHVSWINPESSYHRFFGLDYPAASHAEEALRGRAIDERTYHAILAARRGGRVPPQDTALGGHIGIHGVGRHDPDDHRLFDWTLGCVALRDDQIDALARWVSIGTMVVIQ